MHIICSDLEGVFIPEVWMELAKKSGIEALNLTTRDIPDYNELMIHRLKVMNDKNLKLQDIQNVVAKMEPFEGAEDFVNWIRERMELIILSDTFTEFIKPILKKIGSPTVFCHYLDVAQDGTILNYHLRQQNQKEKSVKALQSLKYDIIAFGDSYNDVTMLKSANKGMFFRPPESITKEFPDFPVLKNYEEIKKIIVDITGKK